MININHNNNFIEIEELNKFTAERVKQLTSKYKTSTQKPVYWSNKDFDFPISVCK